MTKNPIINAFVASAYISLVASVLYYIPKVEGKVDDSVFAPIAFISLFTLSAAMMGYLFFFQPLQLYLDGEKQNALNLFLKTLAVFALITALIFISILFLR